MKTIIGIHCPDRELAKAVGDVLLDMAESATRGSSERIGFGEAWDAALRESIPATDDAVAWLLSRPAASIDRWTDMVDRSRASLVVVDDLFQSALVERIDDMDAAGAETLLVRIGGEGRRDVLDDELFHLCLDGEPGDAAVDYAMEIVEALCDPQDCAECPFSQADDMADLRAELEDLLDRTVDTMDRMDDIEPGSGAEVLDERLRRISIARLELAL
jgi:hypothetical protein